MFFYPSIFGCRLFKNFLIFFSKKQEKIPAPMHEFYLYELYIGELSKSILIIFFVNKIAGHLFKERFTDLCGDFINFNLIKFIAILSGSMVFF